MSHLLGIDISTMGAKALLVGERGQVVCVATTPPDALHAAALVERAGSRRLVGQRSG